jgi:sugar phosphate isomerase/epimerase
MRLGCCAYSFRDRLNAGQMTLEEFVDLCAELKLDGVELTSYYFTDSSPAYLRELKRYCFLKGMEVSGTAVGNNFCQADEGKRREHVETTKEWIEKGAILGAPVIRIFAGPVPEGHTEEEAFAWCVAAARECIACGAQHGVMVALENHGGITATAEQVERLRRALEHPWFGINLDFGNYRTAYPEFEQTAPHAITTHAKTSFRNPQGEHEKLDYLRIMRLMQAAGYRGYISIEYEDPEDPMTAVPRFVEELRRAREGL